MNSPKRIVIIVADRLFLLRPLVVVPALTFFFLGHFEALGRDGQDEGMFPLAVLCYALLMGSVYVINQIADIESDRVNDKLFLLPRGIITRKEAFATAAVLATVSMVGASRIGGSTPLFFGLSIVLGVAYSVPPVALKRRFPLDLLSNAVGYGLLAYAAGWSVVSRPGLVSLMQAVPFALCVGAVFVLTALADREGDERSAFKSTGVVLGSSQGTCLALFLVTLALGVAVLVENRIALLGSLLSLPLFVYSLLRAGPRSIRITYRCTPAIFVLIVGLAHPLFLLAVLTVLGLSRLYYSKRFSLNYPSIAGR